jgi:hypothetical protein
MKMEEEDSFENVIIPHRLNNALESTTIEFRIRNFLCSNLSPETGCPNRGFSLFFSVFPGRYLWQYRKSSHDSLLTYFFQLIIH